MENFKNLRVGLPEVNLKNENKYQPAKISNRERDGQRNDNQIGHRSEFNTKGKVTGTSSSSYHDFQSGSGEKGNFSEKDSSISYLKDRGMKGQSITHYTGNNRKSKEHTSDIGQRIYPSKPIEQVYKKAKDCNHNTDPVEKKYK